MNERVFLGTGHGEGEYHSYFDTSISDALCLLFLKAFRLIRILNAN